MEKKVKINGMGEIKLDSSNYKASGGQADIFCVNGKAIKIYKNPKQMIPVEKIKELQGIKHPNVLAPQEIVYEKSKAIGYLTDFKDNCLPLCQLFTKTFKKNNNITDQQVNDLIGQIQDIVKYIHDAGFLIVDLNEMNILVDENFSEVFFIDTDSYKTPSYKADAIMESIRDPQIKDNKWTENSDWFSFGILSFYLWVGIHPYRGGHPDYKPKEWVKKMKDGVSVFDPKAKLPKPFRDFSMIPASHLEWFKKMFLGNKRLAPPTLADFSSNIESQFEFDVDISDGHFDIDLVAETKGDIIDFYSFMGVPYWVQNDGIYKDGIMDTPIRKSKINEKIKLIDIGGNMPVAVVLNGTDLSCYNFRTQDVLQKVHSEGFFVKGDKVYSVNQGKMIEISFNRFGNKIVGGLKVVAGVMKLSTNVFEGLVIESIFGETHFVIPYERNRQNCVNTLKISELGSYRIIDAKMEENICVVYAEHNGIYSRFIFSFEEDYKTYTVRVENDVPLGPISFTVLPNGVTALATESTLEIFKDSGVKVISNPPFSNVNKLYNVLGTVHYIDGNQVYKAKMK